MNKRQQEILRDSRRHVMDCSVRHGVPSPLLTADELAKSFNEERIRREEEAKRHAMSREEKRIGQAEEELELVMREYGHVPLSADEITEIVIDEAKELTPEVIEKLRAHTPIPLPSGSEFVQTEADDCWARFVDNP